MAMKKNERKQLSSVSTALFLALGIGIIEALALLLGAGSFLRLMGVSADSPMRVQAEKFLSLRALGAPAACLCSRYIGSFLMIWFLSKRVILLPPKFGDLKFGVYLKSGGFLIGRTVAVLITMTIGTSMAARQGPLAMAAHQICMQVWLAVSLLTDGLAASGQVYTPRIAPYARNLMWFVSNGLSFLPTSIYYWL
ncbi:protein DETOXIFICATION 45, chloroplastic-like [Spinacia oleracea]|uniref:Protein DETOXIFICATION 45, chloroplastic-like n=1 Tax=Spinacia oleracea TaxID=3562 RepID=A0ABM3R0M1_SPIOL|nr:protein DETOXIFICATION 45, chloroplastic-like [Spinacia oleracea]XP_056689179.1 protein DETOXIFICATION 45, chloroplastic-like [Spinacia oleracea]